MSPSPAISSDLSYEIVHALTGRLRIRIPCLVDADGWARLARQLDAYPIAIQVRTNPAARSLVICYPQEVTAREREQQILRILPEAIRLSTSSAGVDSEQSKTETPDYPLPWNTVLFLERVSLPVLSLTVALILPTELSLMPLVLVGFVLAAALPTFQKAWHSLNHCHLDVSVMESIWTVLHTLEGQYVAPTLAATLGESGGALREMTVQSREAQPLELLNHAHLYWIERGNQKLQATLLELLPGDRVKISTGTAIPVDGRVVWGSALLDQQSLTGESDLVPCSDGQQVYASTLVTKGQLVVQAEQTGYATRAGRAVNLMAAAPTHDTRIADYAEEISNQAILPSFCLAAAIYGFTRDPHRAIAALQLDFGAGIGITVPTAILAALTAAARNGVYIRSGRALEMLAEIDTLVFDKTGTLTQTSGEVVGIEVFDPEVSDREVLRLAASAEQYLTHPIAEAIVRSALKQGLELQECETWDYQIGLGIRAQIGGQEIVIGNSQFLQQAGIPLNQFQLRSQAGIIRNRSLIYLGGNGKLLGVIFYTNALRPEACGVIQKLKAAGICSHLLTGDNSRVASAVAYKLGLSLGNVYTDALPERKATILQNLGQQGHIIAYVGDGINDAPALAYAHVSISLAGSSDIARQTADVILLDNDLRSLLYGIQLAKQTMAIVRQNLALVVVPNLSAVLGGIFFGLHPVLGVVISQGATLLAELNALSLLEGDRPTLDLDPSAGRSPEGMLTIPWQKRRHKLLADLPLV